MSRRLVVNFFGLFLVFAVLGVPLQATERARSGSNGLEDGLEEVVITASLRPRSILETPASVTLLDERLLREAGLQHLEDVLPLVPNLNWASGTSRPRYLQLRGIGENDQWQGAPNPSVGFLIDSMDFSGIGMPATLIDLGQVEVLRGPQGTTLGANALAGLINLQTRRPTAAPTLRLEAMSGEFGVASLGLVVGGALGYGALGEGGGETEGAAYRFVAQGFRGDGSRRNVTLGRDDTNDFDERTLRWRSRHALGSAWQLDLSALHVELDNGFDAFATDNTRLTRSDDPGRDAQRSRGLSVTLVQAGGKTEFRSTTALVDADIVYAFDGDWAADPDYDFTSRFLRARSTLTQDLRWSSSEVAGLGRAGLGQTMDWVAGLYAQRLAEDNDQLDLYGGEIYRALVSDYRADSVAVYGNGGWSVGERWRASLGVRAEHRRARYRDTDGSDLAPRETMFGGNAALEYRVNERRTTYLTVSRGYKAGGFNIGTVVPVNRREFDAELLHSIEIGTKFDDPQRGLRYDIALFRMRRSAQQVSTSAQLDPGDPLSFIYLTDNAARGVNEGLEAALSARVSTYVTLGATLGVLRARFADYIVAGRDLSGRGQAHAPRQQSSLSIEYREPVGWFARADLQHVAAFYFSDSHDQRSQPYTLLNLRVGFDAGRWRIDGWMRNALDEDYAMRGFFFGNEPPDFADKLYVQLADPRAAGISAVWNLR